MTATDAVYLETLIGRFGPVLVRTGAIGVAIVIGVVVVAEAIKHVDKERERCKKVKNDRIQRCVQDLMPSGKPDGAPYHECLRKCLEANDCWKMFARPNPDY